MYNVFMTNNTNPLESTAQNITDTVVGLRQLGKTIQEFTQGAQVAIRPYQEGAKKLGQKIEEFRNFSSGIGGFLRSVGEWQIKANNGDWSLLQELSPHIPTPTYGIFDTRIKIPFEKMELASARLSDEDIDRIVTKLQPKKSVAQHKRKLPTNRLVDYLIDGDSGFLKIYGHEPIKFSGRRRFTIDFFLNSENRKEWKGYADTDLATFMTEYNLSAANLRSEVKRINDRVYKLSKEKIVQLIEMRKVEDSANSPLKYRWAL